jgi:hypothetical protein
LISKDIVAAATAASIMILDVYIYNIIMPMSPLAKSSLPFQSACVRLNPYGRRYHCEKQIPFCIHDKSILLLGRLGAYSINSPKMDTLPSDLLLSRPSS